VHIALSLQRPVPSTPPSHVTNLKSHSTSQKTQFIRYQHPIILIPPISNSNPSLLISNRKLLPGSTLILSPYNYPLPSAFCKSKASPCHLQSLIFSSFACSSALSLSCGPAPVNFSCAKSTAVSHQHLQCVCRRGQTFIEIVLLLFALLPAAERSVDRVHDPARGLLLGFGGFLLGAGEVLEVVHCCVW